MRRLTALVLALALLLPALPASAQSPQFRLQSGGVMNYSTASASVSNSTAASTLYSFTVPGSYVATQSLAPGTLATQSSWNWTSTVPLHAVLRGRLNTNQGNGTTGSSAVGVFSIGVSYGGTTATTSLINSGTLQSGLSFVPWRIDAYIEPTASATGANTVNLRTRFSYDPSTLLAPTATNVSTNVQTFVAGTTTINKDQTFLVSVQWASATQTNSIVLDEVIWKLGE